MRNFYWLIILLFLLTGCKTVGYGINYDTNGSYMRVYSNITNEKKTFDGIVYIDNKSTNLEIEKILNDFYEQFREWKN